MEANPAVIELIELYLETAKKQAFDHVAIAMTGYPNIAACDHAGDVALELAMRDSLSILRGKVQKSIDNWTMPPRDEKLDASYVRYNVMNGPLGFDYIIWLVDAEMTRIREGGAAPLKVGFWLGHEQKQLAPKRAEWLENVFRPALAFIGAVEDKAALRGRCKEIFVPRDIVAAARAGEKVPMLSTNAQSPYPYAVTITLREAAYDCSRNSNMEAWLAFAELLQKQGEKVIIVRDTAKANEPLAGFVTHPQASWDLSHRMTLYQDAKCNMFVQNGPVGLAYYSKRPWLQFEGLQPNSVFNRQWWPEAMGIAPGEQFPWSTESQRIVWAPDAYENIVSAWENLKPQLKGY